MAFEVPNVLKSVRGKELNESSVGSGEKVTTITEGTLGGRGRSKMRMREGRRERAEEMEREGEREKERERERDLLPCSL